MGSPEDGAASPPRAPSRTCCATASRASNAKRRSCSARAKTLPVHGAPQPVLRSCCRTCNRNSNKTPLSSTRRKNKKNRGERALQPRALQVQQSNKSEMEQEQRAEQEQTAIVAPVEVEKKGYGATRAAARRACKSSSMMCKKGYNNGNNNSSNIN